MRSLLLLLVAGALVGCGPSDAEVRRARLDAERKNLEATFDRLEERLLANQARVRYWREMKAQHEEVSAVACGSLGQHAEEMARLQAPRPAGLAFNQTRVASRGAGERGGSRGAAQ